MKNENPFELLDRRLAKIEGLLRHEKLTKSEVTEFVRKIADMRNAQKATKQFPTSDTWQQLKVELENEVDNILGIDFGEASDLGVLNTPIYDLDLPVRAYNSLKNADVKTLGDLVQLEISDMMKLRNFGKKSIEAVERLLAEKGLSFGMKV